MNEGLQPETARRQHAARCLMMIAPAELRAAVCVCVVAGGSQGEGMGAPRAREERHRRAAVAARAIHKEVSFIIRSFFGLM